MIVLHPSALNQKILRHPSFLYIKLESESYSVVSNSLQLYSPWNSPGQNTRVASLSLLQEIFPTQGSNSGLLHCRQIVYQLSHKGSSRILGWVAYPFLQQIFPTQELNQGLLHYRRILHQLSYQGSTEVTFQSIQQWNYLWSPKAREFHILFL